MRGWREPSVCIAYSRRLVWRATRARAVAAPADQFQSTPRRRLLSSAGPCCNQRRSARGRHRRARSVWERNLASWTRQRAVSGARSSPARFAAQWRHQRGIREGGGCGSAAVRPAACAAAGALPGPDSRRAQQRRRRRRELDERHRRRQPRGHDEYRLVGVEERRLGARQLPRPRDAKKCWSTTRERPRWRMRTPYSPQGLCFAAFTWGTAFLTATVRSTSSAACE